MSASHAIIANPRNNNVLIGMRDGITCQFNLFPRSEAKVSVFDSGFLLGDGLWEGIRSNFGVIQFAKAHLDRLFEASKAMAMDLAITKAELLDLLHQTIDANGFQNEAGVHIRLVVSRGLKATPHQNPLITLGKPLIVIMPEIKIADPSTAQRGLQLFTVHVRRGTADIKDEGWNHLSKATDIQACIQANFAGVDEALMLDQNGYVKTCNSVNFFIVRPGGVVWTATPQNQMNGITRQKTIEVCKRLQIPIEERDYNLTSVYGADEAFATGTFPALLSVVNVDGRVIGTGEPGPMLQRLNAAYKELVEADRARGRDAIRAELL